MFMLHENIIIQGQAAVQDQHLTQNQDTHQDHDALILPGMETCACICVTNPGDRED